MPQDKLQSLLTVNQADIDLIKATFTGNEYLLKAVRSLFVGLPVSAEDKQLIKTTFERPELRSLMQRRFLPSMTSDAPIGQMQDIWLGVEQMVFAQSRETIEQAVQYKKLAINLVKQALALLENPDGEPMNLYYDPVGAMNDPLQVGLLARNQFIRLVEQQLSTFWLTTLQVDMSPAEAKKKAEKDSSQ